MDTKYVKIDDILAELGFGDLDESTKSELEITFNNLIDIHFTKLIGSAIPENQSDAYSNLTAEELAEKLTKELEIDLDSVFLAAIAKAKQDLVRDISYVQGRVDGELDSSSR